MWLLFVTRCYKRLKISKKLITYTTGHTAPISLRITIRNLKQSNMFLIGHQSNSKVALLITNHCTVLRKLLHLINFIRCREQSQCRIHMWFVNTPYHFSRKVQTRMTFAVTFRVAHSNSHTKIFFVIQRFKFYFIFLIIWIVKDNNAIKVQNGLI